RRPKDVSDSWGDGQRNARKSNGAGPRGRTRDRVRNGVPSGDFRPHGRGTRRENRPAVVRWSSHPFRLKRQTRRRQPIVWRVRLPAPARAPPTPPGLPARGGRGGTRRGTHRKNRPGCGQVLFPRDPASRRGGAAPGGEIRNPPRKRLRGRIELFGQAQ